MLDVESRDIQIAKEAVSGKDRLDYKRFAEALAGIFKTGELDVLPTAVGIYAPWGGGKSFLLKLLQKELQKKRDVNETEIQDDREFLERYGCMRTVLLAIWRSALVVILRIMFASLLSWWWGTFSPVVNGIRAMLATVPPDVMYSPLDIESPDDSRNDPQEYRDFIFVDFNAWECAGSDILWASLITKIFDSIEGDEQFGRGLVRATRLRNLLLSRNLNWCGLVTFYLILVIVINVTGLVAGMDAIDQWATVVLGLPGLLTFLKALSQLRAAGFLRTTQTILQDASSKRKSVGASYRGFMCEVKEELEILFEVINKHNADKKPNQKAYTLAVIIDDLDRCPKQQIVSMLQATHLLLEQPGAPMAVFLAVDPRLIVSAVAEVLDKVPDEVTALEYLDKIIHIPFCLPRKSKRNQKNYLDALLNGEDNSCTMTLRRLTHGETVQYSLRLVEATLGQFDKSSRSLIRRVKCGPELLYELHKSWNPPIINIFEHFKSELKSVKSLEECERCFEELNTEVNRVLLRQGWGAERANKAPTPTNQLKDSDSGGETPSVDQSVSQHGGHAPSRHPETSVGNEGQLSPVAPPMRYVPNFTISMDEKKAFEEIFDFVDATPRKIKRVVNVCVLQRYIFLGALEQREIRAEEIKRLRRALVKWTILAEFWPMRLSWVVHEMEARQDHDHEPIKDFYGDETIENSACALIQDILGEKQGEEGGMKSLYFSDATEKGFKRAVEKCKEITKGLVLRPGGLLEHSFNLNPTMMTLVEKIKLNTSPKKESVDGVEEKKGS